MISPQLCAFWSLCQNVVFFHVLFWHVFELKNYFHDLMWTCIDMQKLQVHLNSKLSWFVIHAKMICHDLPATIRFNFNIAAKSSFKFRVDRCSSSFRPLSLRGKSLQVKTLKFTTGIQIEIVKVDSRNMHIRHTLDQGLNATTEAHDP